ncbi:probable serine hydrolase [Diorhabda sublineata]|uniref:probable serine hydrolase n=1 Tax=Diorhabda sublineata TaxID=1163346 RepID=UPI0024E087DD|nr:probable serine hydrolase [Diorhabda sublineata]
MKVSSQSHENPTDYREIKLPVPWGHICGKWWGPTNVQPIVGIHGWQDNSGSFDKLAPYLVERGLSFFCIDLPGHGFSSHIPQGLVYDHYFDGVYYVRRIVKTYRWNDVTFIGHSLGGCIIFLYASIYPHDVSKFVSLDTCGPCGRNGTKVLRQANLNIDQLFDAGDDFCYGYDEMLNILMDGHNGSLDKESCEILLKRGLKPAKDKENCYVFTRDPRLRINALPFFTIDEIKDFASRITCEVLNIRANRGTKFDDPENYDITLDAIKRQAKRFERVVVEGTHHVHLTNADRIAPIILNFLINRTE